MNTYVDKFAAGKSWLGELLHENGTVRVEPRRRLVLVDLLAEQVETNVHYTTRSE